MPTDINRSTSGIYLPPEVASEIWGDLQEQSLVMQLARQTRLPGSGVSIPVVTGDPEAEWVSETGVKPVSHAGLDNKTITPHELAVIEPFSNEFERDLPGLYRELVRRLPGSLAKKFDQTVFFGTPPGSGFDTLLNAPTQSVTKGSGAAAYNGLLNAMKEVAAHGGDVDKWAISPAGEINFLSQLDGNDRPLFTLDAQSDGAIGSLLGRPVYRAKSAGKPGSTSPAVAKSLGFAGDWSSAVWGQVEGVKITRLDQATLPDGVETIEASVDGGEGTVSIDVPKLLHLAAQNMVAIRVEIEVGFVVRSVDRFVRLTDANEV